MLAAAGPPPDPHHHLLISTGPPGRSSSSSPSWWRHHRFLSWLRPGLRSLHHLSLWSLILAIGQHRLPNLSLLQCSSAVCAVWAVLVVLVGPSPWSLCSDLCGAAVVLPALPPHHHHHYPRCHQYTVLYCAPLYCTVLCYTARCSYYPFIYTIRGLRLFVCGECIIRPSCWYLGYI